MRWILLGYEEFGESGGVRGNICLNGENTEKAEDVGGRYVIPMALWRPVMSYFCGMKAIVTSPSVPPASRAGSWTRYNVEGRRSRHFGKVTTFLGSKYFQLRIILVEVEPARIMVFPPKGGRVLSVPS